ncbi:HK97-gp10 family putative phage morphogenesis protein [Mannheimia haemolytica]|uniref:HK97-gp10 family putative phage morphogenesis protein n=1 Tax=Mannheimia haemolytica TaxID=75985 RepID=UPI0013787A04|nr:HK97-gp10 family putative phage morphogenesis protein [Mannheimia haemolytica]NBB67545.1 hypothetical protein [Mannheimia haemolytica]
MSGKFSSTLSANINKLVKTLEQAEKKAMRTALREGAKDYKNTAKPLIPVLGKSTDTRQKGTVKNNLRHRVRVKRKGSELTGIATIRIRRAGGKRMAAVSDNTKDKTDPFYWFMLDRGTKKMSGRNFMARAKAAGETKAQNIALKVYTETMQAEMRKAGF